jgi:NAD(P)-dependent dehydrogenase (short-subunit alcohol dehydrogenase family)
MMTSTGYDSANKLALVTGADLGIGRACATTFARNGYDLILTARSNERLVSVQHELAAIESKVTIVPTDLAAPSGIATIMEAVEADTRGLNVFLSCASVQVDPENESSLEDIEPARIAETFNVTALAGIQLLKQCKSSLSRAQPSNAIFLSSDWALQGSHGPVVFSAAKAALLHGIRTARREFAASGVSLSVLLPGDIASYDVDWSEPVWTVDDSIEELQAAMGNSRIPLVDIAETVLFICQRKMMRIDEMILSPLDPDYDY